MESTLHRIINYTANKTMNGMAQITLLYTPCRKLSAMQVTEFTEILNLFHILALEKAMGCHMTRLWND